MAILTINHSDIGITQKVLHGVEMFFTKTSAEQVNLSNEQSNSSKALYAFNPILNTIVEIDPNQVWFWKSEWLNGEIVSEKEFLTGDFEEFDNIEDFIDSL
jgi:hypothetical protein